MDIIIKDEILIDNGVARFLEHGDLCISYKDWVDKNNSIVDKYNYNSPKHVIIGDYTKDYIKHIGQYID